MTDQVKQAQKTLKSRLKVRSQRKKSVGRRKSRFSQFITLRCLRMNGVRIALMTRVSKCYEVPDHTRKITACNHTIEVQSSSLNSTKNKSEIVGQIRRGVEFRVVFQCPEEMVKLSGLVELSSINCTCGKKYKIVVFRH